MSAPHSDSEWIADLRRRQHDQRLALNRLEDRQSAIEKDVELLTRGMQAMSTAQEIATEVERRLERARDRARQRFLSNLTAGQKTLAVVLIVAQIIIAAVALRGH